MYKKGNSNLALNRISIPFIAHIISRVRVMQLTRALAQAGGNTSQALPMTVTLESGCGYDAL